MSSRLSTRIRGVGPFYIATETQSAAETTFSRAWITEMSPPYRRGKGMRVRLGRYAVQFGTCRRNPNVDESDINTLIEHAGWRGYEWRPDAPSEGSEGRSSDDGLREAGAEG